MMPIRCLLNVILFCQLFVVSYMLGQRVSSDSIQNIEKDFIVTNTNLLLHSPINANIVFV